jgi:fucose 4-O-acetylase-like acetyltransferase
MHSTPQKRIYPFVDYIRFVSMAGIVWAHTDIFPGTSGFLSIYSKPEQLLSYIAFKQIFKFSVISFFMISGYLLADQLRVISPMTFLMRRVGVIVTPYIIAFTLFLIFLTIQGDFFIPSNAKGFDTIKPFFYKVFYSPYWFIPVYFLTLITILVFHKYVYKIWFGGVLMLITSYYTFSELSQSKDHTTAFMGFVFYVWLGMFINEYKLVDRIKKWNTGLLLTLVVIAFALACYQSYSLFLNKTIFYFNNLRFFNQVYGVLFFCLLIKICPEKPNFGILNPRKETYGIYLYHYFAVLFIIRPIIEWLNKKGWYYGDNFLSLLFMFFCQFLFCYIITTVFVKLLNHYKIPVLGLNVNPLARKPVQEI